MKSLEFIYQETEIHFLLDPRNRNVMINATEMAKIFNKRVDRFTRSDHAKAYINALKQTPNGVRLTDKEIVHNRGRNGIYFHRKLALYFAAWLDVNFHVWVFDRIDEIVFQNYQNHWDAHARQEEAKLKMESIKSEIIASPTAEKVLEYFEWEREYKNSKNIKTRAIRNQLKLFKEEV